MALGNILNMNIFRNKNVFGLSVSDNSIEAVELSQDGEILKKARLKIPAGLVECGEVREQHELAEKIGELIEKSGINTNKVVLVVPESCVFTHVFDIDREVKSSNLREEVARKATETLPLRRKNIYWDYKTLSFGSNKNRKAIFVAALKASVDKYIQAMEIAGLEIYALKSEMLALGEVLLREKEVAMIIKFNNERTHIGVFDEDKILRSTKMIKRGKKHLCDGVKKNKDESREDIWEKCKKYGLDPRKGDGEIMNVLQHELKDVLEEAQRAIDFSGVGVKKVLLAGEAALINKIDEYFSTNLEVETQLAESGLGLNNKEEKVLFATAIGAITAIKKKKVGEGALDLYRSVEEGEDLMSDQEGKREKASGASLRDKAKVIGVIIFVIATLSGFGWIIYNYVFTPPDIEKESDIIESATTTSDSKSTTTEGKESGELVATSSPAQFGEVGGVNTEKETANEVGAKKKVEILETPTGWLRVRAGPGTSYEELDKVDIGNVYPFVEEEGKWYKIRIDSDQVGWIFSEYAKEIKSI